MKHVKVMFIEGYNTHKKYSYNTFIDVRVNDLVVVEAVNTLKVARVTDINEEPTDKATKYVVDRVDIESYDKHKERQNKINELKAELYKKKKLFEEQALFEMLAEKDPTVKELLNKIKNLESN